MPIYEALIHQPTSKSDFINTIGTHATFAVARQLVRCSSVTGPSSDEPKTDFILYTVPV
jgi:hypothetical protein